MPFQKFLHYQGWRQLPKSGWWGVRLASSPGLPEEKSGNEKITLVCSSDYSQILVNQLILYVHVTWNKFFLDLIKSCGCQKSQSRMSQLAPIVGWRIIVSSVQQFSRSSQVWNQYEEHALYGWGRVPSHGCNSIVSSCNENKQSSSDFALRLMISIIIWLATEASLHACGDSWNFEIIRLITWVNG